MAIHIVTAEATEESATFQENLREVMSRVAPGRFVTLAGESDICFLHAQNQEEGRAALTNFRQDKDTFLAPVLYLFEDENDTGSGLADEILRWPAGQTALPQKLSNLKNISASLRGLSDLPSTLTGTALRKILLLRYLHTRTSRGLKPERNFAASVGYSYPVPQALLNVSPGVEFEMLEGLEEAQLLTGDLVDKVNVCPYCEHTQLNFRELCPNCNSIDIQEETTIHHYRCSYVGRESAFQNMDELVCPKCSRELRHIGVDYDKPAEMLWCSNCQHNFAEPKLSCFCLNCGRTSRPEDVFIKNIKSYSLTQEGILAAQEGTLPGYGLINILKKELGFYKREVFSDYVQLEMARCKRYQYDSTVARFSLKDASASLDEQPLKHSRKLRKDVAAVIRETFRRTDLFTDSPDGEIVSLFTNTDTDSSNIAFDRLNQSLSALLETKMDLDYELYDVVERRDPLNQYLETIQ